MEQYGDVSAHTHEKPRVGLPYLCSPLTISHKSLKYDCAPAHNPRKRLYPTLKTRKTAVPPSTVLENACIPPPKHEKRLSPHQNRPDSNFLSQSTPEISRQLIETEGGTARRGGTVSLISPDSKTFEQQK